MKTIAGWKNGYILFGIVWIFLFTGCHKEPADIIVLNGKIITVDSEFSKAEALAVRGDRISEVGSEKMVKRRMGPQTLVIDARGNSVIPGLIDAHLHPEQASLSELYQEIPDVHTLDELLAWIKAQAVSRPDGDWILFPKFFYLRLKEMRPPTLEELDAVAPDNPVFLDGSYGGVVNSAALKISGIDRNTKHPGIIRDKPGNPLGLITQSALPLLKLPPRREYSHEDRLKALRQMLLRYNRFGITSICSGSGGMDALDMYNQLKKEGTLTTRVFVNFRQNMGPGESVGDFADRISKLPYCTGDGDEWVRTGALKITLDGGILTGTAFLREPWGEKACEIFGLNDPQYRGVVNYDAEELLPIVEAAARNGWKFTAHCTGGGGVDLLLDVFQEVNRSIDITNQRFSIIHGNFFTSDAVKRMKELGVCADMQAAWFYKDADAMNLILGEDRINTFLPYRSLWDGGVVIHGGSDHMVKYDANSSVNPYNPFLSMWSMITRKTESGNVIVPEEAITREEALKMYTINNAFASFEESLKGSLEPGKLADIAILSGDFLHGTEDQIKHMKSEVTITGGRIVYTSGKLYRDQ